MKTMFALAACLIAASTMGQSARIDQTLPAAAVLRPTPRQPAAVVPVRAVPAPGAPRNEGAGRALLMLLLNSGKAKPFGDMSH